MGLTGRRVSAAFFKVLGVRHVLGRNFLPNEDQPGAEHVAIVSYATWQNHLNGDPWIVGKKITLDDESYTVIGVMPRDFQFSGWAPADRQAVQQDRQAVPVGLGRSGASHDRCASRSESPLESACAIAFLLFRAELYLPLC